MSSYLASLLDLQEANKVIWHNKQTEQPDYQWSLDIYVQKMLMC